MSVKVIMATILQDELTLRGVNWLTLSDYQAIVERMIEQLTKLEPSLAAREMVERHEP